MTKVAVYGSGSISQRHGSAKSEKLCSSTSITFDYLYGKRDDCLVGEYLMTLPQHLEPYMSGDTSHLARAFREAVFPGAKVTSVVSDSVMETGTGTVGTVTF